VHPDRIKNIATRLTELSANTAAPFTREFDSQIRFLSSGPDVGFCLVDDYVDKYDALVDMLLREEGYASRFSRRYMAERVTVLIAQAEHKTGPELERAVVAAVSDLDAFEGACTVYVPLTGVELELEELPVGAGVLRRLDKQSNESVSAQLEREPLGPFLLEGDTKTKGLPFGGGLLGKTCVEFSATAEPERAKERAESEARRIVDLLRYVTPVVTGRVTRVVIGLLGEVPPRAYRPSVAFRNDQRGMTLSASAVGAVETLRINEVTLRDMERGRLSDISSVLAKPNPSEFENAIILGVHWIADAVSQAEPENMLLALVTALETYLSPRDGRPIASAIAEAAALLLLQDLEERKELKRRIVAHYDRRSRISHGGKRTPLREDFADLLSVAITLTVWMVDNAARFQTLDELHRWFEDVRLSCVPPN